MGLSFEPANETLANWPQSPYKGLQPYLNSRLDAALFFGRDLERDDIIANLQAWRLTILYSASGVGKSSLLQAGVAHQLEQYASERLKWEGAPECAVVVFNRWQDDPLPLLIDEVEQAVRQAWSNRNFEPLPPSRNLVEVLGAWTHRLEGELYIIFDQFEEYFLYHQTEGASDSFELEFARAVNNAGLPVHFLVAIREDALYQLERFHAHIPNLFDHLLRLEYLDISAARLTITRPLDIYNDFRPENVPEASIEENLIEALLVQLKAGQVMVGEGGAGGVEATTSTDRVDTAYLQLVLSNLWELEQQTGSSHLKLETLEKQATTSPNGQEISGAQNIARTNLDATLQKLTPQQQALAARLFRQMVTTTGMKIALSARDLADEPEEETAVEALLNYFAGSQGGRILRTVVPPYGQAAEYTRYEIFHDLLAPAILDWRTRYEVQQRLEEEKRRLEEEQRQNRERLRRRNRQLMLLGAGLVLALLLAGLALFQWNQASYQETLARYQQSTAEARGQVAETANANAEIGRQVAETANANAQKQSSARATAQANAEAQELEAKRKGLIAQSRYQRDKAQDLALLLAVQATLQTSNNLTTTAEARVSLADALSVSPRLETFLPKQSSGVYSVAFSADGNMLASGGDDKQVYLWDLNNKKGFKSTALSAGITSLAFSSDKNSKILIIGRVYCQEYV
jgi:hypothetical protein